MIVIERDGQRTVVTGWRAWLIYATVAPIAALLVVAIILLAFGMAFTIGTVLLFAIPLALVFVVMARILLRKQLSGTDAPPEHSN
jgi:membrane protein implicated in regulation of membrane protease activity